MASVLDNKDLVVINPGCGLAMSYALQFAGFVHRELQGVVSALFWLGAAGTPI